MGVINLPDPPRGGGTYSGSLELSRPEAEVVLERLSTALSQLQSGSSLNEVSRATLQLAGPPGPPGSRGVPQPPARLVGPGTAGFAGPPGPPVKDPIFQGMPNSFHAPPGAPGAPGAPAIGGGSASAQPSGSNPWQQPPPGPGMVGSLFNPMQGLSLGGRPVLGTDMGPGLGFPMGTHMMGGPDMPQAPPPPPPMLAGMRPSMPMGGSPVTPSQQWARAPMQVRAGAAPQQPATRQPVAVKPPAQPPARKAPGAQVDPSLGAQMPVFPEGTIPQPTWRHCWTTESEDHSGKPVSALLYSPTFKGLPREEGHAGWLVSSSRCLLNLWECAGNGRLGSTQPSLMLMHSQVTDFRSNDLSMDPDVELLMASSVDINAGTDCVSLHTLSPDSGFLAYKARLPVTGTHVGGGNMQRVVSLNLFGGPLSHCCAASLGGNILVYNLPAAPKGALPARPKAEFRAHGSQITALHRSRFSIALFSGAMDGTVHMWDLKVKPSAPIRKWGLQHRIADICVTSEHQMVTAAADGAVRVWDLRYNGPPVASIVPDGSPIVAMSQSPFGSFVAVATTKGLYSVDVGERCGHTECIAPPGTFVSGGGPTRFAWNTKTMELYVSMENGRLSVYSQK